MESNETYRDSETVDDNDPTTVSREQFSAADSGKSAPITEFYLTGLRTDGRSEIPNFFTFLLEQEGQLHPLLADGQIVLFTHLDLVSEALQAAGIEAQFHDLTLDNVYLIDVAMALHLLAHESADERKVVANLLDLFARTLTALGIALPPVFEVLMDLGSYADANTYLADFLNAEPYRREQAVDGVRWCLGTILSVSRIISKQ